MLKSQITKGHHNTPTKRIGKAFPDTEGGRALLLAYAVSQLGVEQKASLQIDLSDTIDNFDYELIYRLYDNNHVSMPERIYSFYVVDGKIIVPSTLPRTVRNYIRMDVRLGYLEFYPIHSTDIHLSHKTDDITEQQRIEHLQRSVEQTVLSSPHLVRQPTYATEAPRSPTRLYGESVDRAEVNSKHKEAMEEQIKKLKEKYPSKTEEEIRQGLENWIK